MEVPIRRTTVFWSLDWGPPILGNYHIDQDPPGTLNWSYRALNSRNLSLQGGWLEGLERYTKFRVPGLCVAVQSLEVTPFTGGSG